MDARDPQLLDDPPAPTAVATDDPPSLDGMAPTGERRRRRRRSATRNAIEWVLVLVGALAVAVGVKTWLFQAFYIPSGSMEPTLEVGDRVLVNKLSYDIDDVARGDIIVFSRPPDWETGEIEDLIKRVIGLPGDVISSRDGRVYVNGEPLDEPWLSRAAARSTPAFDASSGCVPSCQLGSDELFVLGDNRANSSASNRFGPIDFEYVIGRAFVRVWPLDALGTI